MLKGVPVLAFLNLGTGEIIFILLVILLLFGAHKIPDLARSLGRAQHEFQRARDDVSKELEAPKTSEEARIQKAARDLGIPVEGKNTEELKAAIARAVQPKT